LTNAIQDLKAHLGEAADLFAASAVLEWDQVIYMPRGGSDARAQALSTLAGLAHEKMIAPRLGELLEAAAGEVAALDKDSDEARLVRVTRREYDRQRKVPTAWVGEFTRVTSTATNVWEKAKATSDFSLFRPHLEHIVAMRREYVEFFAPYDSIYDPLLDSFEPGMKTAEVSAVFSILRPALVDLVQKIAERASAVDDRCLQGDFDEARQWDFGVQVLKQLGYDFNRGRQDRSVHPFTTTFSQDDVRITTRFLRDQVASALMSTIHEGGHALYEQGVAPALARTPLAGGASMVMHESQSRMWENLIGRSRPFWKVFYPLFQKTFVEFAAVPMETFYRALNKVTPSLIRVEADEVTYSLHIMLRFELELALLKGDLAVKDLPAVWNQKMKDYLGVVPPDDARGVLQDVHWSGGSMGYFPTYALGNLVSVQLFEAAKSQSPQITKDLERGEYGTLLAWLRENVHRHGAKFESPELLRRGTGETLTPHPYIRYLQSKFGELYGF
jgi:carboxypeptidase Taq